MKTTLPSSYDQLLVACVRYLEKHGQTQTVIDRLEEMLPGSWACELTADAMDIISTR